MGDDLQLLERYSRQGDEAAFAEVLRRHLDLVHSTALRHVRSAPLAEEVAQSVFTDLARQARHLAPGTILSAWLWQVTRRSAIDAARRETRRRNREHAAYELTTMNTPAADWIHIEPLLDEALHALDDTDRAVVLLRWFENKSLREIGAALGTSEDAAQKRASRALDRLRDYFARRGITATAAALSASLSANAVQAAPAGMAAMLTGPVLAAGATNTVTAGGFASLLAAFLALMTNTVKITLAVALIGILAIYYYYRQLPASTAARPGMVAAAQLAPVKTAPSTDPKPPLVITSISQNSSPAAVASLSSATTDPRAELGTAISEAIHLIETNDELAFQKKFGVPDEIKTLEQKKNVTMDQLFTAFDPQDRSAWLRGFNQIAGLTPTLNESGNEAVFELNPPIEKYFDTMTFVKVDGLWYFSNKTTPPSWYLAQHPQP